MSYDDLSEDAKLADKVWRHMVYGKRFENTIPSTLRALYIIPIFGKEVSEEIRQYYLKG